MADGQADINQCPPGGAEGVVRLAAIAAKPVKALNPENGLEGPRAIAVIDENWCIGCTLCLDACPTDAILGANKMMHTVIEVHCTGCELCLPVCPVDCISLENVTGSETGWKAWSPAQADEALRRYEAHRRRATSKLKKPSSEQPAQQPINTPGPAEPRMREAADPSERKRSVIEAALARARAQRESKN